MDLDERPDQEPAAVRVGGPAVATALFALVIVAMFAMPPGTAQTATLVSTLVVNFALILGLTWRYRGSARPPGWPQRWHQFIFMWGATTAYTFLTDGPEQTALDALGRQFFVALILVVVLWLVERWTGRRREPVAADHGGDDAA
jgi:putative flippase GtrA